jgi:hypothetical protein
MDMGFREFAVSETGVNRDEIYSESTSYQMKVRAGMRHDEVRIACQARPPEEKC